MKKISFAIIAAFSFFLLSCEKNIEPIEPQNNEPKLVQMTFNASVPGTRTAIGDLSEGQYSVTWSEGDQIRVIAVDDTGARIENDNEIFDIDAASVGSENASFTGTTVEGAAAYYAVYPASLKATVSGVGDAATIALSGFASHEVEAVEGGFDPTRAVMFAAAEGNSFTFKHGMVYFKLTISAPNVASVELSCKTSDTRIYGDPTYKFSDGSISDSIGNASKDNNYIILSPSTGTLTQNGTYFIPVIAKNRKLGELTLTYTDTDGVTVAKKTSKLSTQMPVNGTVYDLGTPPVSFNPSLTLLKSSVINIPYEEAEGLQIENAYKLFRCTDDDIVVSCDREVITSASIYNGTVTYSISANEDPEERTGHIYLQLGDNDALVIDITQLANGSSVSTVNYTWNFTELITTTGSLTEPSYVFASAEDETAVLTYYPKSDGKDKTASSSNKIYLQPNGGGAPSGSNRRYFTFKAPSAGTLTINGCSNKDAEVNLLVYVNDSLVEATSGGSSSNTTPTDHVFIIGGGEVVIYANATFRYYSIAFSNE